MANEHVTEILLDFKPYRVTMPIQKRFVGRVDIVFPDHHLKIADLSMGGALPGAHVGSDARVFALHMDIKEPGMRAGDVIAFLADSRKNMETLYQAVQQELDRAFLL